MLPNDYIYFILNKDKQLIKIGHTKNPTKRFWQLQNATNDHLEICAVFSSVLFERYLHQYFAPEHVEGEWFACSERLLDTIKRSQNAGRLVLPHEVVGVSLLDEMPETVLPVSLKRRMHLYFSVAKFVAVLDIRLVYFVDGLLSFLRSMIRRLRHDN